ncbi:hypothetical protein GIB67_034674 [Kingdonia uniflora]|uniref:Transmembrane protein n=1 Tax=Kingdonia uniflora TaxID=39325 RepID=A0A7J7P0R5_9MAGN|nr:hypothetical protein GIB67_034674 [Kingdonia uniflora]
MSDSHEPRPEVTNRPPPGKQPGEVLHQRRNLPSSPLRMAAVGFVVISTIGYLTLYSKKKPKVSALEVPKVATGVTDSDTTRGLRN